MVQFECHPEFQTAASMADYLHDGLNDDPAVPRLRVPTCYVRDDGSLQPPDPMIASESDRVVVVLLADDHFATHARHIASRWS
jgi:hypothetical protein